MTIYPGASWRPVSSHGGLMTAHLGLILHVQVGSNSCYPEFSNVKNEASSTWWVSKTGLIEQYVDADAVAWAEADGNATYDSVETEGVPGEPLTGEQIGSLGALYRWGHDTYGWPYQLAERPGDRGFGWHGMGGTAWGGHIHCPGDLRKAQRQQILDLARSVTPAPFGAVSTQSAPSPPVQEDIDMSAELTIIWPDGTKTVGYPNGDIECWPTENNQSFGSFGNLRPDERKVLNWPLKDDFRALVPVDLNNKGAGYLACCVGVDGEPHEFKFDRQWAVDHGLLPA